MFRQAKGNMKSTDKIIDIIRNLREEGAPTNSVGSGNIAGTIESGDDPPVKLGKKKRKTPIGRYGSRKMWITHLKSK